MADKVNCPYCGKGTELEEVYDPESEKTYMVHYCAKCNAYEKFEGQDMSGLSPREQKTGWWIAGSSQMEPG